MFFDNLGVSFEHDWQWASTEHFVFCENTENSLEGETLAMFER